MVFHDFKACIRNMMASKDVLMATKSMMPVMPPRHAGPQRDGERERPREEQARFLKMPRDELEGESERKREREREQERARDQREMTRLRVSSRRDTQRETEGETERVSSGERVPRSSGEPPISSPPPFLSPLQQVRPPPLSQPLAHAQTATAATAATSSVRSLSISLFFSPPRPPPPPSSLSLSSRPSHASTCQQHTIPSTIVFKYVCVQRADNSRRPGSESETYEQYLEWQDRLKESEAAGTQFTCFTAQLTCTKVQILTRKAALLEASLNDYSQSSPAELFSPQERLVGGVERAERAKIQRARYSVYLLYWHKSANADAAVREGRAFGHVAAFEGPLRYSIYLLY